MPKRARKKMFEKHTTMMIRWSVVSALLIAIGMWIYKLSGGHIHEPNYWYITDGCVHLPFSVHWLWYALLGPIISCVVLSAPRSYKEKRGRYMFGHITSGVSLAVIIVLCSRLSVIDLSTAVNVALVFLGFGVASPILPSLTRVHTVRGNMLTALIPLMVIVAVHDVLTITAAIISYLLGLLAFPIGRWLWRFLLVKDAEETTQLAK